MNATLTLVALLALATAPSAPPATPLPSGALAASLAAAARPMDAAEFEDFTRNYYLKPAPDRAVAAIEHMRRAGIPADADATAPLVGFFAELFAAEPERLPERLAALEATTGETRACLTLALESSGNLGRLLAFDPAEPSPSLNDMCWGAFFASGKEHYLRAIAGRMEHLGERRSLLLFLTASSAQWSLAANARMHPAVAEFLESATGEAALRARLDETLALSPEAIQTRAVEIVRRGREAKSW